MPTVEHVILRELLAREPEWVSGSVLAAKLGVSRVAVWQHMEKLRAAGFGFEAQRSRGYRIATRPATLVGSSRVDLQACKLEYSIVSPK